MAEYRHSSHAVTDLKYHIVWITKYRHKVMRGDIAERAQGGDSADDLCGAGGHDHSWGGVDHLHLLVSAPPQLSQSKLVQFIKGRSSRLLQREFPELRKRYWGQHLWARGYFCASVGAVDDQTIREYIENQRWDEDVDGFKVTTPREP